MALIELAVERVLLNGEATGPVLRMARPISFWGGIDPRTGCVSDPRHPQHGQSVAGQILAMTRVVGSSSGSSVMMELLAIGKAPAGLLLTDVDAILTLGVIVGREMGYGSLPVFLVPADTLDRLTETVTMTEDGRVLIDDLQAAASD